MFKRRRFPVEIILVCVRWYCKYGITYRDLAEMMQERGVDVDASTIFRWVQFYAPELEKRVRSRCRQSPLVGPVQVGLRLTPLLRRRNGTPAGRGIHCVEHSLTGLVH
jgi:hypothetical protein